MDVSRELVTTSWLLLVLRVLRVFFDRANLVFVFDCVNFVFVLCDLLVDKHLQLVQCVLLAFFTQGLADNTDVHEPFSWYLIAKLP